MRKRIQIFKATETTGRPLHQHSPGTSSSLDRGCVDDKQWQWYWRDITALPIQHYNMPSGKI
eukprot:2157967-Ditylum_brightwellii.AAC.1